MKHSWFVHSKNRIIAATVVFGCLQLLVAFSGLPESGALSDDAFYYFQVAKNAAAGRGFSFDGVYATNGFHPLFAWILVPVFEWFGSDAWLPVRIANAMLGLATTITGYLLYIFGRKAVNDRAGEIASLLFFVSPFSWILTYRGCEGPFSALFIALGAVQMARMQQGRVSLWSAALLGTLVGFAGLARTENVFWAIPVGVWLAWRARAILPLGVWAACAAVVVSPWLVWSAINCGTMVQVSGAAKVALTLFNPLPPVQWPHHVAINVGLILAEATRFVVGEEFQSPRVTLVALAAQLGLILLVLVAGGRRRPVPTVLPIYGLVVLHIIYYGFVQRSYYSWYFLPVALGLCVFAGERLAEAPRWMQTSELAGSAALGSIALLCFFLRYGYHPRGVETALAPVLAEIQRLPKGARAGAWNAGRIGYFGAIRRPDVTIFNLDCLVNNQLFSAWKAKRYSAWVLEHVGWLVEHPQGSLNRGLVEPVNDALWRIRKPDNGQVSDVRW